MDGFLNGRGSGILGRPGVLAALVVFGSLAAPIRAQEPVRVTCPVVADATVFSALTNESAQNLGGAQVLQTRGSHSFVLLRFDLAPADGLLVTGATLRLRRVENLLTRVGVSTIAAGADWPEGTATQPKMTPGTVCFRHVAYHQDRREARYWARPGSDLSDVVFANGGSRWVPRVAEFDRASHCYEIDIPPEFVQAMMLGLQPGGLCLSDDFGRNAAAPTFCSRESQDPPVLIVTGQRTVPVASRPPEDVTTHRDALGAEWVTFSAPRAIGFEIYLSKKRLDREEDLSKAVKLDTWAMPAPGAEPRHALLSLHRSAPHRYVAVRAVEMGGQWSPLVSAELPPTPASSPAFTAPELKRFDLPEVFDRPFTMDDGPSLSEDGRWVRTAGKTWWDSRRGPISLQTGRNEFVSFQIILAGGPGTYVVTLADWTSPGASEPPPRVQLYRQHYVRSRLGREKYAPDALLPLRPSQSLRLELLTPEQNAQPRTQPARRRVVQGIWADVYVPHKAARGTWRTRVIVLRDGQALLDIPLELEVLDLSLPDKLGFQVSLGSEKLPGPLFGVAADSPAGWDLLDDYHRLAHEHRVTLTIVPYGADGKVHPGFAPVIEPAEDGPKLDWADWDRRFGRYLDGSAFRDLPREAVPLAHFCLPLHENWPMLFAFKRAPARSPLAGKYHFRDTPTEYRRGQRPGPPRGSYMVWPIENAFSEEYREGTASVLRGFAEHLARRGWDSTEFLLYLHNKCSYKDTGSWWNLREPAIHDDFLALGFWLGMYRRALADCDSSLIRLRADIAQPQFQRETLDGLLDLGVLNEMFFAKNWLVLSHPEHYPRRWLSCDTLAPEVGWSEALKRGWAARLAGAGGLACRRSLGTDERWDEAGEVALMYPGDRFEHRGPYPSLRLKALRRVQQDMDWLGQWVVRTQAGGVPEGYALSVVGAALATRSKARLPYRVTLLPNLEFPGLLDTVAFEEIRRGLRQALLD